MFAVVIVYLWIGEKILTANSQVKNIRQNYLESQKNTIRTQVKQAVEYTYHQRSLAEKRARAQAKSRTNEAWEIASYIYNRNKNKLPVGRIQQLVHDALYAASWDGGKGYYFVVSMSGIEMVNRNTPELEGRNVMAFRDSRGTYLTKAFIKIVTSPAREGFLSYYYPKPGLHGVDVPKISFVKYFQPLDWMIANGMYILDEEENIKEEVIERLEQIKFGSTGYIFVGTWDGLSLAGLFKGKNVLDSPDSEPGQLARQMINLSKSGGGFIQYLTPRFEGHEPASKISYIEPIPEWQWYIGTGLYIDAIEVAIQEKQQKIKDEIRILIVKCIIVLFLFLMVSFLIVRLLSGKIEKNLKLFSNFFKRSEKNALPIEMDKVTFSEFKFLADSANQMATKRKESEASLRESEKRYRTLFESSFDSLVIIDGGSNTYVDCNTAALKLYGLESQDQFIGMAVGKFSPERQPDGEKSKDLAIKHIDSALLKGSCIFEWTSAKQDGTSFPTLITLSTMYIGNNKYVLEVIRDLTEIKTAEEKREQLIEELKQALSEVKILSGLLPICSSCKKIRDDKGYWKQIDSYIEKYSDAVFSHGLCPKCTEELYGDQEWYIKRKNQKKTE
ncbi:MAG: cache domain-containing protein [Desulfobacter sp.]|nr:MAG: cache domain-containing protein [Desulfobacter sp.]